jgi:hypothetical protein
MMSSKTMGKPEDSGGFATPSPRHTASSSSDHHERQIALKNRSVLKWDKNVVIFGREECFNN